MTNPYKQEQQPKKSGLLDKIGEIAAEKILPKLVELLWPRIAALFMDVILPKLVALLPLVVANAVKGVIDQIPGIDLIKDANQIADDVTEALQTQVPDIDIPFVSDAVKDVTGFDLTDFLRNFNRGSER